MKYNRTYRFVSNNVMFFNEGGKICTILNNALQKATILLLAMYTMFPESAKKSGKTDHLL